MHKHEHTAGHEGHEDHPTKKQHAHVPHESPKSMWVPLVVLAILATVGGFVGISTTFTGGKHVGGRMNIVNWLNPVIWNPTTKQFNVGETPHATEAAAETKAELHVAETPAHDTGFNLAHTIEEKLHSETLTEWVFILISLIVAGFGIALGLLFYIKSPNLADVCAARLQPLYQASYHKYWIDEFFGLTVTRRTMDLARGVFAFD